MGWAKTARNGVWVGAVDTGLAPDTWRESGASSKGVSGLGENGAKWVRAGAVDTGLALDRPKYKKKQWVAT